MSLLKFFLRTAHNLTDADIADDLWKEDPLRHPEVERMSMREVADLPLGRQVGFHAEANPPLAKCA